MHRVVLNVNGNDWPIKVASDATLLDALRDLLGLTGAKRGCNQGVCGACTVMIDGRAARSCLRLAIACEAKKVETVESLAAEGVLTPLQQAFADAGAVQCGFCIPGMVIAATALLQENPTPTEAEIREALAGNLCRCSGYVKIVEAVQIAADKA
jgi:aerobic-type carbon monoxide dehydrogenase small subunit (CoxS/CutS family)